MRHHNLKTLRPWFDDVVCGKKRFEIRVNDRDYKEGDTVTLEDFDGMTQEYSGRQISFRIRYVTDFEQREGYVVFGLDPL